MFIEVKIMMLLILSLLEFCRIFVCSMVIFCVKMDFIFLFLYIYNIKLSYGEDFIICVNIVGIKLWRDLFFYVCWWFFYIYFNDFIVNFDCLRLYICVVLKIFVVFLKRRIYLFFFLCWIIMKYNKLKWL